MRMDALVGPMGKLSCLLMLLIVLSAASTSRAQEKNAVNVNGVAAPASTDAGLGTPSSASTAPTNPLTSIQLPDLSKRETVSAAMRLVALLTVLSLAPAILIMMTSFTRIIIVLSLLRQALGTQQLPPNQIIIGLSLFMTFLVMQPTWQRINQEALSPYMNGTIDQEQALKNASGPIREFMESQIVKAHNEEDVRVFTGFAHETPKTWGEVSMTALIPGFILSELKIAFLLGFKIYLPFLVIDIVISTVLISMGMMMLPPVLVSLPFKLLLFVLVDGWRLITMGLMGSFS